MTRYFISLTIFLLFVCGCGRAEDNHSEVVGTSPTVQIIQKLLDDSELNKYFHVDVFPKRVPLILVTNKYVMEGMNLHKFGQPVAYMDKQHADSVSATYLEISSIEIKLDNAVVNFRYRAEGIRGHVMFKRDGKAWKLIQQKIVEM